MVKSVLFDAGNTILFPDYDIYVGIAGTFGADVGTPEVVAAEAVARAAFDNAVAESPDGDVHAFWPVFYTPFYEALGVRGADVPLAIEATRAANDEDPGIWRVPVEGFDETMRGLSERGMKTGIVSNSDGRLDDRMKMIGIRDRFDFVIDSAVVRVSKPDPRIFTTALGMSGVEASEAVFVGDYYEVDVAGARAVGMLPLLFDPAGAYGDVDCGVMRKFTDILEFVDRWNDKRQAS